MWYNFKLPKCDIIVNNKNIFVEAVLHQHTDIELKIHEGNISCLTLQVGDWPDQPNTPIKHQNTSRSLVPTTLFITLSKISEDPCTACSHLAAAIWCL